MIEEVQAGMADFGGCYYFQPSTSQHGGSPMNSEFDAVFRSCAALFLSMHATSSSFYP